MAIFLSDTTPAAPAGGTNITWQKDASGNISAYVTTSTELTSANIDLTNQSASIGLTNLLATPVAGLYRVSAYVVVTTAAGTSSTLPSVVISWNDQDNGQAQTLTLTPTNSGNALTTYQQSDAFLSVGASAPLAFSTTGYASNAAAAMKYALHIRVEIL